MAHLETWRQNASRLDVDELPQRRVQGKSMHSMTWSSHAQPIVPKKGQAHGLWGKTHKKIPPWRSLDAKNYSPQKSRSS